MLGTIIGTAKYTTISFLCANIVRFFVLSKQLNLDFEDAHMFRKQTTVRSHNEFLLRTLKNPHNI